MQTTKYVRHSFMGFFLWDAISEVTHLQMATQLGMNMADLHSAGFVQWHGGQPLCTGLSASLGLGCKPGDSVALMRQLGIVPLGQTTHPARVPMASPGHA